MTTSANPQPVTPKKKRCYICNTLVEVRFLKRYMHGPCEQRFCCPGCEHFVNPNQFVKTPVRPVAQQSSLF